MSNRLLNWSSKLPLFIEEKRNQPFAWGTNDCCLFVCDWVAMMTGVDPATEMEIRGTYTTALAAARILKAYGGVESIAEAWASRDGWERTPLSLVKRGSLVSFRTESGPALGVCLGGLSAYAGLNGVIFVPTESCSLAWNIP